MPKKGRRIMYKSWKKDDMNVPLVQMRKPERATEESMSAGTKKEYICRALLIQTVLPKSRARAYRDAVIKWKVGYSTMQHCI